MNTPNLPTMRVLASLLLLCTLTLSNYAQVTDRVLLTDYKIDPESAGDLSVEVDATLFFKNNEFDGKYLSGYSLPGMWVEPKLVYTPLPYLQIEAGLRGLVYRGTYRYPNFAYSDIALWKGDDYQRGARLLPFMRAQIEFKGFNFVLGNIYGGLNHGLIEPLYNPELNLTADPESGFQLLYDCKRFHMDLWLNWESFIYKNDTHQEAFTLGLSTKTLLNSKEARWHLYMPVQLLGQHRGGEDLLEKKRPVSTLLNGAIGIGVTHEFGRKWFKTLHVEADLLGYYQQSGDIWPFDKGLAGYIRSTMELREDLLVNVGYLRGKDFISLFGSPYFGAVSNDDTELTFGKAQTVTLAAEYYRTFAKHYGLGAKVEIYYAMPGDLKYADGTREKGSNSTNFTIGVYIRLNPSFLIKKFNKK